MKSAVGTIFIILGLFFFTGCESKKSSPLTIGMCPWPGYEPIPMAENLGFFKHPIKIIRYSSPHEAYKAFKNGALDVVALTVDELLKLGDSGMSPKVFLITDISKGADALVVHPTIRKLEELQGKRIGLESSVLAQYFLQRILDHSKGLKRDDVRLKTFDIVKQHQAYIKGEADAFITFEPARSALIASGAKVLFDSSMIPNEILDVVATRQEVIDHRTKDIKMFIQGWYKAMDYIQKYPDKAYAHMGKIESISKETFENSLEGIEYGTKELNQKMLHNKQIIPALKRLKQTMITNHFIEDNNQSIESLIGVL